MVAPITDIPQTPFKAKTVTSWAGEQEGDLGFIENEIVEVYSIVDEGWWSGRLRRNKAEGIFPRDYVEIIPETPQSLPHSSSNASLNTPKGTPIKEYNDYDPRFKNSRGGTPTHGWTVKASPSRNQPFSASANAAFNSGADTSFGDDGYAYDTSYDAGDQRKSGPKKSRSSNKLVSSTNHPKHKHISYMQQEELLREREREIENFKLLQQKQNYHLKKSQQDYKRASVQPQDSGELYSPRTSKSKSRPQSQLYGLDAATYHKSHSYNDVSAIPSHNKPQLFNNHTVESFSPEHSPPKQKMKSFHEDEEEYHELANKRAQLEFELQQLKQLERSTQKRRSKIGSPSPVQQQPPQQPQKYDLYDPSTNSSYVSEDIHSSKKNYQSREDLGKKLTKYVTDEDEDYELERSTSPPPPPPPKHATPVKAFNYHDEMDPVPREISSPQNARNQPKIAREQSRYQLGGISVGAGGKVPFDADDFKFSGNSQGRMVPLTDEDIFGLSAIQQEELKNSIKSLQSDVLNLSELSATSAGSFTRHKYEKEMLAHQLRLSQGGLEAQQERLNHLTLQDDAEKKQLVDSIFQDKKKSGNIFKKFLTKRPSETNPIEKKFQEEEEIDWSTLKFDINRMNSLTSQDKQARTRRIVMEQNNLIFKPLDYISDINTNEFIGNERDIDDSEIEAYKAELARGGLTRLDTFMENYTASSDLNELISDISVKYNSSKINQIRSILIHMCKFRIIDEPNQISQVKPKLNEILSKGEATIYQLNYLFKKVLDALRIPSEIVLGFWKKPNEFYHNEQYIINHCWLSILYDNQFLIIDTLCFKNGAVCNIRNHPKDYNEFYFLTKPLHMVSTHIPSIVDLQHVIPPIDQNVTFYLPRVYSGFYKSRLGFRNFNNALTRLKDLEFFELELDVPVDVELFSLIKTAKVTTNELSLCQILWVNNKRVAKIKAILPENESIGVLQIFSGPKGLQRHFDNIHELSIVIPLYHTGTYKPCKFVPRFPTVQSQNNDLYIKHPQTSKIVVKNSYIFEVLQYPSLGLNSSSGIMNQDFKVVIESPSGKYFKLMKSDPSKPFGVFESNIKCQEVGLYRGLVIGDSGNSWYVFAQWDCVGGIVNN